MAGFLSIQQSYISISSVQESISQLGSHHSNRKIYTDPILTKSSPILLCCSHILESSYILHTPVIDLYRIEEHIEYIEIDPDGELTMVAMQAVNLTIGSQDECVIKTHLSICRRIVISECNDTPMIIECLNNGTSKSLYSDLEKIASYIPIDSVWLCLQEMSGIDRMDLTD